MAKETKTRFLNYPEGDDLDFYEEYTVERSDYGQQIFLREFMSEYAINENRIVALRDPLYRRILRKIKRYEEEKSNGRLSNLWGKIWYARWR